MWSFDLQYSRLRVHCTTGNVSKETASHLQSVSMWVWVLPVDHIDWDKRTIYSESEAAGTSTNKASSPSLTWVWLSSANLFIEFCQAQSQLQLNFSWTVFRTTTKVEGFFAKLSPSSNSS